MRSLTEQLKACFTWSGGQIFYGVFYLHQSLALLPAV